MGILAGIFDPKLALRRSTCSHWQGQLILEPTEDGSVLRHSLCTGIHMCGMRDATILGHLAGTQPPNWLSLFDDCCFQSGIFPCVCRLFAIQLCYVHVHVRPHGIFGPARETQSRRGHHVVRSWIHSRLALCRSLASSSSLRGNFDVAVLREPGICYCRGPERRDPKFTRPCRYRPIHFTMSLTRTGRRGRC